jgi:hypothetical protein
MSFRYWQEPGGQVRISVEEGDRDALEVLIEDPDDHAETSRRIDAVIDAWWAGLNEKEDDVRIQRRLAQPPELQGTPEGEAALDAAAEADWDRSWGIEEEHAS